MALTREVHVRVDEPTRIGQARRAAVELAGGAGLDDEAASRVATVVTELGTNLVKHADGGGDIVVSAGSDQVDVLAFDRGPGIPDIGRAMQDGFSSLGTRGEGLGAVERAADHFELRSTGTGTTVLARFGGPGDPAWDVGGASIAKPGEDVPGDAWTYRVDGDRLRLMVADGLGHGPGAAAASGAASAYFAEAAPQPLEQLVQRLHQRLRPTRGAAIALVELRGADVRFVSIGNVAGQVLGGSGKLLTCTPGTVGHAMRTVRAYDYRLAEGEGIVVYSDGVRGPLAPTEFPGLARRSAPVVAGAMLAAKARGTDDATVALVRRTVA